jgi:hypothetical protein
MLLALLSLALVACGALGLGTPVGRPIPLGVKETDDRGTCASSGYEVDVPPHATVATIASVCVRPYRVPDASSSDADASSLTAAGELVRELEGEAVRDAR